MGIRKNVLSAILVSLVLGLAGAAVADGDTECHYDAMLRDDNFANSVQAIGLMILALPHERENLATQIENRAWYSSPDVVLDETGVLTAMAELWASLDGATAVVTKYGIQKLGLVGFSPIGMPGNLDLYYGASTPHGPVIFRVSVQFGDEDARLFDVDVFEGWPEAREAMASIEHRGETMPSVTYAPEDETDETDEPDETDDVNETIEADGKGSANQAPPTGDEA